MSVVADRRRSNDSAISIASLEHKKEPIFIYQLEKSFRKPPTIRVSSRTWTTLSETTTPQQQHSSSSWSPRTIWNPSSATWQETSPPNRHFSFLSYFPSKWSRKQNLHCILVGLLVCVLISLSLGLTLHRSEATFDGSRGPTGSAPSAIPGPALPVLGFAQYPGNASAVYFGVSIDWKYDDPAHFNSMLKYPAAIHDTIFSMGKNFDTKAFVNSSGVLHEVPDVYLWSASLIRGTGAIMGMTIIPSEPLSSISIFNLGKLAEKCKEINQMGIPILLRFAPEMNGNWFAYGQDPLAFRNSFQRLTNLVRNATNNTAMVWSPASGLKYPFRENLYSPSDQETRFLALDTNLNGILDEGDNPFSPYYPGENYTDWVGMSSYYSSGYEFFPVMKNNCVFVNPELTRDEPDSTPTSTETASLYTLTSSSAPQLTNAPVNPSINNFESQFSDPVFNFYKTYGSDKKKPVLLNTGSTFFVGDGVSGVGDEVEIKRGWSDQILNRELFKNYPFVRGVVFADFQTLLDQTSFVDAWRYPGVRVDYGISTNSTVLGYYQDSILSLLKNKNGSLDSVLAFASSLDFNLTAVVSSNSTISN